MKNNNNSLKIERKPSSKRQDFYLKPRYLFIVFVFCVCIAGGIILSRSLPSLSLGVLGSLFLIFLMPFFLNKVHCLLLLFVALIPFLLFIPAIEDNFSILAVLGLFVLWIWFSKFTMEKDNIVIVPQYKYLFAFTLIMFFSLMTSNDRLIGISYFKSYLMLFLLFFLVVSLIKTPRQLLQLGWILIVSLSVVAFIVLLDQRQIMGSGAYSLSYQDLHRNIGIRGDPNFTALEISVGIPFAICYLMIYKKLFQQIILSLCLVILIIAVIMTYSSGGAIGLLSILILFLILSKNINTGKKSLSFSLC